MPCRAWWLEWRADLAPPQLLSMMRVGVLHGGMPHALEEKAVPPSQHLRVTRYNEVPKATSGTENADVAA